MQSGEPDMADDREVEDQDQQNFGNQCERERFRGQGDAVVRKKSDQYDGEVGAHVPLSVQSGCRLDESLAKERECCECRCRQREVTQRSDVGGCQPGRPPDAGADVGIERSGILDVRDDANVTDREQQHGPDRVYRCSGYPTPLPKANARGMSATTTDMGAAAAMTMNTTSEVPSTPRLSRPCSASPWKSSLRYATLM